MYIPILQADYKEITHQSRWHTKPLTLYFHLQPLSYKIWLYKFISKN